MGESDVCERADLGGSTATSGGLSAGENCPDAQQGTPACGSMAGFHAQIVDWSAPPLVMTRQPRASLRRNREKDKSQTFSS